MNWKIFTATFLLIFLAELGDKTQLAALTLSAKEKTALTIFVAAVLGFALSTLIAVVLGTFGAKIIPTPIIEKVSAMVFIIIGLLMLFNKI